VGIGPFNLSLAALLSPKETIKSCFFDKCPEFIWHPGMLLPEAQIQVSFLNDLVTMVDPNNPFSFLNYLAKQKRLYRFINAQFTRVHRQEFSDYLRWVSHSLPHLYFNEEVVDIQFKNNQFLTTTSKRQLASDHLVLGTGNRAFVPLCTHKVLGKQVFHNKDFLTNLQDWTDKKVTVIGGGQSGAELINYLLSHSDTLPKELNWVTRRSMFYSLDDSGFANDYFTPYFNDYFYQLSDIQKAQTLKDQKITGDGISLTATIKYHLSKTLFT
jgi:lysine N6-hydroxylase